MFCHILQARERFLKESAFEDVTLEAERKRIFKDFMHVLEVSACLSVVVIKMMLFNVLFVLTA